MFRPLENFCRVIDTAFGSICGAIMWAAAGDNLGLRTLWTDAPDAHERLDKLRKARRIGNAERDDLAHFIDHGWLIWRGGIELPLIDAFAADIRSHHQHPGMFLTTNHCAGVSGKRLSGTTPDRYESLFDLHVNLRSSRDACLHPKISRFLSLVFETKPVLSQQLLFQRSNGHLVHQDTSVVTVEDPLLLAATWIALEDVVEGSGELAFYDRSHKLPHYIFKDGTKRMSFGIDSNEEYMTELDAACRRSGMAYERFLARKGDVFIWAADLVHRSHPRSLPDGTSRLSCVTHYHPETTTPFWFRHHPGRTVTLPFGELGSYVSAHYPLSRYKGGMIAPESPFMG
jgi:phytanoyl-CoA hydroxylase